ncbi:zinc finger protein [Cinnamomum micranthum f. kanehirae]|uniref:Zinc finger protein n=1 Tax=Cinnamomum micranthum f. kanehirae TaxID=337451 RepID=A0A3S3P9M6_9MAGN|nr:zinc finger protein [Cinnamomum micranthum f. kanehirae]
MSSSNVNHLSQPCIYGHSISSYTERKFRLMKWLAKLFKGSGRGASNGRHPQLIGGEQAMWREPSRSLDNQSRAENEEMDHAIALSLAEDARKPNGYGRHSNRDDELARALQERLNMSSYPPYKPPQFYPRGIGICGGCNHEIGYGQYLTCMGAFWHPQCFRCHFCHQPITESEYLRVPQFLWFPFLTPCFCFKFSLSGSDPYHKSCYRELHHPKCDVCHKFIPINRAGLIEYRAHPFWNQKYCPSHEQDKTARCCSCERLESRTTTYVSLEDGRSLCLECLDSAVMDTGDCQPLYHAIRDYYEGMNMKLDQQIPMLLVERQALNEAMEGEKDVRVLITCLKQGVYVFLRNRLLPVLLTGSILAHELMHGWLRLKGYRNLSPEVEEGICQVLSHMWLESEVMPGSRSTPSTSMAASSSSYTSSTSKKVGKSDIEKKLGEFFMHQIVHDSSPAYGEGFRAAYSAVNRYGLRRTLEHIRLTGYFPV